MPDETMVALREHFTDEQIVELTCVIGCWEMHSTILEALRMEFDDRDDPIREVPGDMGSVTGLPS